MVEPWTDQEIDVEIRFAEHEMFQHNLWRRRNAATLRELLELRAKVAKWPMLGDGSRAYPGMTLHIPGQDEDDYPNGIATDKMTILMPEVDGRHVSFSDCYSTLAAAEAAKENK